MNILLIAIEIIISILFIIYFYKKEKYEGLCTYIIIAYLLSIITSVKNIEILTVEIPLGIILTTSIYIVSYLLVQDKGIEATKKIIKLLLIIGISFISIIVLTSSIISTDPSTITNTYSLMFINKLRIVLITAIVPLIIIYINSILYYQLKREKNNIIVNSLLSSIIIFFIDATIFSILSFIFVIPITSIFITIATIYLIKIIMSIVTIPITYTMQKIIK